MSLFKPTIVVSLLSADVDYKFRHKHPTFGARYKKDADVIHTLTPKSLSISTNDPNKELIIPLFAVIFIFTAGLLFSGLSNRFILTILLLQSIIIPVLLMVNVEYLTLAKDPEKILTDQRVLVKHAVLRHGVLDATYSTKWVNVNFKEIIDDGEYMKVRDLLLDEGIKVIAIGEAQFKTGNKKLNEKKFPIVNVQIGQQINRTYIALAPYGHINLLNNMNELSRFNDHSPTGHSQWITYTYDEKSHVWNRDWVKSESASGNSDPNFLDNWWNNIHESTKE